MGFELPTACIDKKLSKALPTELTSPTSGWKIIIIIILILIHFLYASGGEPMARVPKVARETISRGTPSLRNLPKNNG